MLQRYSTGITDKVKVRKLKYRKTTEYKYKSKLWEDNYKPIRKTRGKTHNTEKLKQRIECQFKTGMSWENYGDWHIDHKKPISKFGDKSSVSVINMLCNLQPLWKKENLSKSNKF